jgi:crotonobetainyl-CoA:carnitine CoA-transferase CaiB-like acyl-CoA transferase
MVDPAAGDIGLDLLSGVRVLSFNHFLMGPFGVQHLADLGADVIVIEPIEGGFQRKWGGGNNRQVDGQTVLQLAANRNKRSLAVDLKSSQGIEIARKLVVTADVVSENYRPAVMKKLGLDYESVRALNPSVIYASASGYGPTGPYVDRPGQDLLVQALAGLMAITGKEPDGARAVGVSAVDHHGAALLALGILAALVRRGRTGQGCRVDVSLLSAAIDLQLESFTTYFNGGAPPATVREPPHLAGWYYNAPYGVYRTKDGHMALSLAPVDTVGRAMDIPALIGIPENDVHARRVEIADMIAARFPDRTNAEWVGVLTRHSIWHAPVNGYAEVVEDPQVRHIKSFMTVPGAGGAPVTLVSHPVMYDGAAPAVRFPPQFLGAQTREVLAEIGYADPEIDQLAASGVVGIARADHERNSAAGGGEPRP